ncbi:MAG: hypothetical protein ABIY51_02605 [Ferruginibacter sp.]
MKASTVKEIKSALESSGHADLLQLCMRLIKFKKENKELATYVLFEAENETGYIIQVKDTLDLLFAEVNKTNLYFAKKNLRKITRTANRFIKYTEVATTEVDILLYVAEAMKDLNLPLHKSAALLNIFNGLLKKIEKVMSGLHEDLQYDYHRQLSTLKAKA